jgi:hypothetical protein
MRWPSRGNFRELDSPPGRQRSAAPVPLRALELTTLNSRPALAAGNGWQPDVLQLPPGMEEICSQSSAHRQNRIHLPSLLKALRSEEATHFFSCFRSGQGCRPRPLMAHLQGPLRNPLRGFLSPKLDLAGNTMSRGRELPRHPGLAPNSPKPHLAR